MIGQRWAFKIPPGGMRGAPRNSSVIAGAPFVYFDSFDSNKRWLLYAWRAERIPDSGFNGNNISAHAMETNRLLDATSDTSDFVPIAYRYSARASDMIPFQNYSNAPIGWPLPLIPGFMFNGFCDQYNQMFGMESIFANPPQVESPAGPLGVAEGPGAFDIGDYTYIVYVRNRWNSGAYGSYYRREYRGASASSFSSDCKLSSWSDDLPEERPLVRAVNQGAGAGRSFGRARLFNGPIDRDGNRTTYAIFHSKNENSGVRTPYFKDLILGQDGWFGTVMDTGTWDSSDANVFLTPWTKHPCLGQLGDADGNGFKESTDINVYLDLWFSGHPQADLDGDSVVGTNDIFVFLDDWFLPCW